MKKEKEVKSYWSMTEGVFNCLIDKERSLAFQKAINNTVKKDDIVVDMGTGSGILAMFAAKAGAKKVYAVEFDKNNISNLENIFKSNNLDKIIQIIEGDARSVKLPEKVTCIIGEMIATGLVEEQQIQANNNMLDNAVLNPKVLLNKYNINIELVDSPNEYYGLVFPILRYEYPDLNFLKSVSLSKKIKYQEVDFAKKIDNTQVFFDSIIEIKKPGQLNGIKISGETVFYDNSKLGATFAYDYPLILPVKNMHVNTSDKFMIKLCYNLCGGFDKLTYSICKI